jgi:TonB family protein
MTSSIVAFARFSLLALGAAAAFCCSCELQSRSATRDGLVTELDPEDFLPDTSDFVPIDEPPQPISLPEPEYPEMARQAGISAVVWVTVLIDKRGDVRDAFVSSVSVEGLGFEEAALEAAMKGKWLPGMLDGQPVAVWVSYMIAFTLDD